MSDKFYEKYRKFIIKGYIWIKRHYPRLFKNDSIMIHHGIKGQKWGVKNGPPYPIDKLRQYDTIVTEMIRSGAVSKTVNREKQRRHTLTGHAPGRSYIYGDEQFAQELIDKLSGTGEAIIKNGKWTHRERVVSASNIGSYVNYNGESIPSNVAIIVYSKTGAHIYPVRRKED